MNDRESRQSSTSGYPDVEETSIFVKVRPQSRIRPQVALQRSEFVAPTFDAVDVFYGQRQRAVVTVEAKDAVVAVGDLLTTVDRQGALNADAVGGTYGRPVDVPHRVDASGFVGVQETEAVGNTRKPVRRGGGAAAAVDGFQLGQPTASWVDLEIRTELSVGRDSAGDETAARDVKDEDADELVQSQRADVADLDGATDAVDNRRRVDVDNVRAALDDEDLKVVDDHDSLVLRLVDAYHHQSSWSFVLSTGN